MLLTNHFESTVKPVALLFILWFILCIRILGILWWLSGKESTCQCRRCRFNPWVRMIPWRRKWQPTAVSLPGKSHGRIQDQGIGWDLSSRIADGCLLLNPHMAERDHFPFVSSYEALIPLRRFPLSCPNYIPKLHLQMPSHWRLGLQHLKRVGKGGVQGKQTQTFSP